jgi:2'-5' RNA ligase
MIAQALSEQREYREYTAGDGGCYVSVVPDVTTQMVLSEYTARLGFYLNPVQTDNLHVTLITSRLRLPEMCETDASKSYVARLQRFEYWEGHDKAGYLVAVLNSPALHSRHSIWSDRGAVHSSDVYRPHVTLVSGLMCTQALYKRMMRLSDQEHGAVLRFYNEKIEDPI